MLEDGYSINYIHSRHGIGHSQLEKLWFLYQKEGSKILHRQSNIRSDSELKCTVVLDIENKVAATITPMERIETPLWNKVALREAVINAIVHNDYSFEVSPKFEIFPDRLEITSAGRLPESLTREEFFNGISIPRNKELMRIYRDMELVESLGSGIPRILRAYGEDCFKFTDNFIRITLPISVQDGTQSAPSQYLILKTLIN